MIDAQKSQGRMREVRCERYSKVIVAAVIDDDKLEIGVTLREHAFDRLRNHYRTIVYGQYH